MESLHHRKTPSGYIDCAICGQPVLSPALHYSRVHRLDYGGLKDQVSLRRLTLPCPLPHCSEITSDVLKHVAECHGITTQETKQKVRRRSTQSATAEETLQRRREVVRKCTARWRKRNRERLMDQVDQQIEMSAALLNIANP